MFKRIHKNMKDFSRELKSVKKKNNPYTRSESIILESVCRFNKLDTKRGFIN